MLITVVSVLSGKKFLKVPILFMSVSDESVNYSTLGVCAPSLSSHLLHTSSISCEIALALGGDKGPAARNVLLTFYHISSLFPSFISRSLLPSLFPSSDLTCRAFMKDFYQEETRTKHMKQVVWTIRPSFSSVKMIIVPTEGIFLYFCLFIGCYRFVETQT